MAAGAQATFEMQGTTFTIGYDDERLARRIVHSVVSVGGLRAPASTAPPAVESMLTEGLRNPTSAQVCAYRREPGESSWQLVYATTLGAKDAATYHGQVYDGGFESAPDFCDDRLDERVLVTVTGDDPYGGLGGHPGDGGRPRRAARCRGPGHRDAAQRQGDGACVHAQRAAGDALRPDRPAGLS